MLKVPSRNKASGPNAVTKAVILVSFTDNVSLARADMKRWEAHLEELASGR